MPKDIDRNRYFSIAVPKQSPLLQDVESAHDETNIAEGQLIVFYATEYVRMKRGGTLPTVVVPTKKAVEQASGMQVIHSSDDINEEELDLYGEPD